MEFVEIGIYLIGISFISAAIEVVNITSASRRKEPKILKFKVWYFFDQKKKSSVVFQFGDRGMRSHILKFKVDIFILKSICVSV